LKSPSSKTAGAANAGIAVSPASMASARNSDSTLRVFILSIPSLMMLYNPIFKYNGKSPVMQDIFGYFAMFS
jgi:hypothetical protein